ncbi:mechanosensitive ion channel family protein, partial [candidate division KSB1 bacterium]
LLGRTEMLNEINFNTFILPASLIIVSLIVGYVIDRILIKKLLKKTRFGKRKANEILVKPLKGHIFLWFILFSISVALRIINLNPEQLTYINKFIIGTAIFSVTIVIARSVAGYLKTHKVKVEGVLPSPSIITYIAKIIILGIGFLVLLQTLGITIAPLLTALGVGGLAVALALQETLSNLFAGFHIIASKQFTSGDYIQLESGQEGYIQDVTWRNTIIRTFQNNMIVVPNSKIASVILTNYNQPIQEMKIRIPVGISYDSDLEHVERVTLEVADEVMKEVSGGIPDSKPVIRYRSFDDSSISFRIVLSTAEYEKQYIIQHEFIKRLHKRYKKEGIVIPFPIRTIYQAK